MRILLIAEPLWMLAAFAVHMDWRYLLLLSRDYQKRCLHKGNDFYNSIALLSKYCVVYLTLNNPLFQSPSCLPWKWRILLGAKQWKRQRQDHPSQVNSQFKLLWKEVGEILMPQAVHPQCYPSTKRWCRWSAAAKWSFQILIFQKKIFVTYLLARVISAARGGVDLIFILPYFNTLNLPGWNSDI